MSRSWRILAACLACLAGLAVCLPAQGAGLEWTYQQDDQGRLVRLTGPGQRETSLEYVDAEGRLELLRVSTGGRPRAEHRFDSAGRRTSMLDQYGEVRYSYDGLGRLAGLERQGQPRLGLSYDSAGRLTRVGFSRDLRLAYYYDFLGRLTQISTPAGKITLEHSPTDSTLTRRLPNGVTTIFEYRPDGKLGRLAHISGPGRALAVWTYHYRPDGRLAKIEENLLGRQRVLAHHYDQAGRLVRAEGYPGGDHVYTYDSLGNLLSRNWQKGEKRLEQDWDGALRAVNGAPCAVNAARELTELSLHGEDFRFSYQHHGLLRRVEAPGGEAVYGYNGEGLLLGRFGPGAEVNFQADPLAAHWRPLVWMEAGAEPAMLIWHRDRLLGLAGEGITRFYLEDHLGSVRLVLDQRGKVVARRDYHPYGLPAEPDKWRGLQPGFAGLLYDATAGVYLAGARAYHPRLGRFLQRDPAWEGLSAYAYCGGDPVNLRDLSGRRPYQPYTPVSDARDYYERLQRIYDQKTAGPWDPFTATLAGPAGVGSERLLAGRDPNAHVLDLASAGGMGLAGNTLHKFPTMMKLAITHNPVINALQIEQAALVISNPQSSWTDKLLAGGSVVGQAATAVGWSQHLAGMGARSLSTAQSLARHSRALSWLGTMEQSISYLGTANFAVGALSDTANHYLGASLPGTLEGLGERLGLGPAGPAGASGRLLHDLPLEAWGSSGAADLTEAGLAGMAGLTGRLRPAASLLGPAGGLPGLDPGRVGGISLAGAEKALASLGPLQGVALDPATDKLVLLAERQGAVPLPPLRLEDVVTIFRTVYEHGQAPFVSIDPDPQNPRGPRLLVRHDPGTQDTYVGWVLFESDRVMKCLQMGRDNLTGERFSSQVAGYASALDSQAGLTPGENVWERFWIVPAEQILKTSRQGRVTLVELPLMVKTQRMELRQGKLVPAEGQSPTPEARRFAEWFTGNYEALAREQKSRPPQGAGLDRPVAFLAELQRMAVVAAVAQALRDRGVPMPAWMSRHRVPPVPYPDVTPSIIVERTTTTREVQGGRSVRTTSRKRIYGGVDLGDPDRGVHQVAQAREAEALESRVEAVFADPAPLSAKELRTPEGDLAAVSLPGDQTLAVGPNRLEAADITVPVGLAGKIELARGSNSFFAPHGEFGRGWSMDLPRLESWKEPVGRKGKVVRLKPTFRLDTPLASRRAYFHKRKRSAALRGEVIAPEGRSPYEGVARVRNKRLEADCDTVFFKDGRRWAFDRQGRMVADEAPPLAKVYRRDRQGRVRRIEGWYGDKLLADIQLEYNQQGRIARAQGSNGQGAEYAYDDEGRLASVDAGGAKTRFSYQGSLVREVKRGGQVVASYSYGPGGRLLSQSGPRGGQVDYRLTRTAEGVEVQARAGQEPLARQSASPDLRRLSRLLPDGTRWDRESGLQGGSSESLTTAAGRTYRAVTPPAGGAPRLELPSGATFEVRSLPGATAGAALLTDEQTVAAVEWRGDGQTSKVKTPSAHLHCGYRADGSAQNYLITPPVDRTRHSEFLEIKLGQAGQLTEITGPRGRILAAGYDQKGRVTQLLANRGLLEVAWDAQGRPAGWKTSWGGTLSLDYHGQSGALAKATWRRGGGTAELSPKPEGVVYRHYDGGVWRLSTPAQPGGDSTVQGPEGFSLTLRRRPHGRALQVADAYRLTVRRDARRGITVLRQEPSQRLARAAGD
jgi:RHS repeat-associated protein